MTRSAVRGDSRHEDSVESEARARELAEEEAALQREASLRRIATLVAGGTTAEDLFSAVAREVSVVLGVPVVTVGRYELDGGLPVSVVLASREHANFPVGSRWPLDGEGTREIYEDRRRIQIDDFSDLEGTLASAARQVGMSWVVGAPIIVDGVVWGNIYAGTAGDEPIPEDAESQLADFTALVSTAIANSDARGKVGQLLDEQAALRRVATRVAEGTSADELFALVSEEVGALFGGEAFVARFEFEGPSMVFVGRTAGTPDSPGTRTRLEDTHASAAVYRTGRPARYDQPSPLDPAGTCSTVAAPIEVEGNLWGVLAVHDVRRRFPPDTEERVLQFTELVATAIANTESRSELAASEARARRLADEQAALRRVATLVAAGTSADELFTLVADEVRKLFDAEVAVGRFEPDESTVVVVGLAADAPPVVPGMRLELDDSLVATTVRRTGRPARREGRRVADGAESTVAAPIIVEGKPWGVIAVNDLNRMLPPDTEERVLQFTELVATAIANMESRSELAASEERSRGLAEEQAALRRVATLVAREPPSETFLSIVAREVACVLNVPGVIVQRYDPEGTVVTLGSAFDSELSGAEQFLGVGSQMPRDPGSLAAQVFETHRPARIDDFSTLPGTIGDLAREAGIGSGCAGPIVVNGDLWGKMCVFSRRGTVLPVGTENRLHDFIELVATAIANYEARADLAASEARARELADEQAALRRVATLVAQGASPEELFAAVVREVARVMDAPIVGIRRYEEDGTFTVLGNAGATSPELTVGSRWPVAEGVTQQILATGRTVRRDGWMSSLPGAPVPGAPKDQWSSTVAVPIVVEGRIWGFLGVSDKSGGRLPADAEERLERFTELVATAVANAEGRAELEGSRARIVATADATRRRIERDLHDGAQQQLVGLALALRAAQATVPEEFEQHRAELSGVVDGLSAVLDELREIALGIHPAGLSEDGLTPALKRLVARSPLRVNLDVRAEGRFPEPVEVTAYYVVSEALTNAAKYAETSVAEVALAVDDRALRVEVRDEGRGGADPAMGSGLLGLRDRVEAIGGTMRLTSPPGAGTSLTAVLPLGDESVATEDVDQAPAAPPR